MVYTFVYKGHIYLWMRPRELSIRQVHEKVLRIFYKGWGEDGADLPIRCQWLSLHWCQTHSLSIKYQPHSTNRIWLQHKDWEFESWFQLAPSQRFRCQEMQQACFSPLFVKRCKWERICFSYMICYLWVMFIFPLMFRAGKNRIF